MTGMSNALMLVFVVVASLSQIGIQTTSFVAIVGAAGLAVGLARQGSLSNFAPGVLLIIFKPYKVDDYIVAGGGEGNLKEIRDHEPRILAEPKPTIGLMEMGDSSINFAFRPWVKVEDYWDLFFDLQERIKIRFDEEGITIPSPSATFIFRKVYSPFGSSDLVVFNARRLRTVGVPPPIPTSRCHACAATHDYL